MVLEGMTKLIEIATCSYGEYLPEMGYPVKTSRGAPKWFEHPYMGWDNVFPRYSMLQLQYAEYRVKYLQMLHILGKEKLRGDIEFIAEEYAKVNDGEMRPLVLLCFEKLSKGPDNWCHRTMLAGHLEKHLGFKVVELGATKTVTIDPEPTLF